MDEVSVSDLVAAAAQGDQVAWNALVSKFVPLVRAVARRHRLGTADVADVSQTVWLRLVEHLGELRDPRALPSWIATVARNESLRLIKSGSRTVPLDDGTTHEAVLPSGEPGAEELLLRAEQHVVLRTAFAALGERCRQLLGLLMTDPAPSYDEVSRKLGMQVGSIGPTRGRCLDKLRNDPSIQTYLRGVGGDGGLPAMGCRRAPPRRARRCCTCWRRGG